MQYTTNGAIHSGTRVLCAVDIDEHGRRVFAYALAAAQARGAGLLLLHAPPPDVTLNKGAGARVRFLRELKARGEAAGVNVRVVVQSGPVADIIVLHAQARRPDLIVLGVSSRERRRGLSGWIAERVMRGAPCPT